MKLKVISGGQTGADLGGLRAAKQYGIPTGGCAAVGFKTENGVFRELESFYFLHDKGYDYVKRTEENVKESDITFIYADNLESAGTKLTIKMCKKHHKPYRINTPSHVVSDFLVKMNKIVDPESEYIVNIAGNRESVAPGIRERTERMVGNGIKMYLYVTTRKFDPFEKVGKR